ncbi:hypothetical protein SAMN05720758_1343 [Fibrobacter sp. UWB11]|nr:hypothetical protein SAMN05720758_1343 [Fibrobacter sp. UWB11]
MSRISNLVFNLFVIIVSVVIRKRIVRLGLSEKKTVPAEKLSGTVGLGLFSTHWKTNK